MIIWENMLLLLAGVSKFNVVTVFSSNASLDNLAWLREEYICCSRGLRVKWGRPHQVNHKSYSHLVPLLLLLPSTGRCFSPPITTPNNIPFQNERRRVQSLGRKFDMDALITHPSLSYTRWIFALVCMYNTNPVFHFIFTLFRENAIPDLAKISQEITGLDGTQLEALKGGFEGFDKENTGCINSTQSQMIFKMMGVQVQVSHIFDNFHAPDWSTFIRT